MAFAYCLVSPILAMRKNNRTMKPTTYKRPQAVNLFNFFDEVLNSTHLNRDLTAGSYLPATNILEAEDAYHLEIIAPGRKREDFTLEVKDEQLTIRYQVEQQAEEKKEGYLRKEFKLENFQRSFHLDPKMIDEDSITAQYQDGILSLRLPKKEAALPKQPKLIAVGN